MCPKFTLCVLGVVRRTKGKTLENKTGGSISESMTLGKKQWWCENRRKFNNMFQDMQKYRQSCTRSQREGPRAWIDKGWEEGVLWWAVTTPLGKAILTELHWLNSCSVLVHTFTDGLIYGTYIHHIHATYTTCNSAVPLVTVAGAVQ